MDLETDLEACHRETIVVRSVKTLGGACIQLEVNLAQEKPHRAEQKGKERDKLCTAQTLKGMGRLTRVKNNNCCRRGCA